MLKFIRQLLEPPNFPGDETKTSEGQVMHTVGLYFVLALSIAATIYIPFFANRKLESWLIILALFVLYLIARALLFRGQLRLAGLFLTTFGWIFCAGLAYVSDGISSPMMFALAAITIAVGLLFHPRVGTLFLVLNILVGLELAALQQNGALPEHFLSYSPLGVWFYFALSLIFINWTMNLTVRNLRSALARAREQNEAREKAEATLRRSEALNQALISNSPIGVSIRSPEGQLLYANKAWKKIWAMPEPDLTQDLARQRKALNFDARDDYLQAHQEDLRKIYAEGGQLTLPNLRTVSSRPGAAEWVSQHFYALYRETGEVEQVAILTEDVTERKQAEDRVNTLLREKETLLKEVHHRIKNNMNTIASLLELQLDAQTDPAVRQALQDAEARVQSMMVLYDKLYRSETFDAISIRDYVPALLDQILELFPSQDSVKIQTHLEDIVLVPKLLYPLGIILNELTTNAMKYAFVGRSAGVLTVSASREDDRISIIFEDDGVGIPGSFSFEDPAGFGIQLVHLLVQQMQGSISMEGQNGTKFIITFASV
jgi:PAS domain S-box-containing protein